MAQVPCTFRQPGEYIDYTPVAAAAVGTVVVIASRLVTIVPSAIDAGVLGAVQRGGFWNVPKDSSDVTEGDDLYWDDDGNPVDGDAGSGAFTKTSTSNVWAGIAAEDAGTAVGDVDLILNGGNPP